MMIQLLRNNFRSGGAIRLDHVMAFCRLFWIPRGRPASEGTYVQYPFDDLLAIVALESTLSKTLVIGEDLGTVPDWVREQLAKARVLSYRVFYFERGGDGAWKSWLSRAIIGCGYNARLADAHWILVRRRLTGEGGIGRLYR
jgi:4-alpha-glucanotransferase